MPGRAKYAVYVYDIPVDILQKICTTLDNDKGWKDLAAKCGYNMDKVSSFGLEYCRPHGSPTERLIGDWGVRNPTIFDLYEKLRTIDRIREMKLLEPLLEASKEYERQERVQREAEEKKAKEREAQEQEAKKREAMQQAKKEQEARKQEAKAAMEEANNFDKKSEKSKRMPANPLTVAGPLTANNGGRENVKSQSQNYAALNQLDSQLANYEALNLVGNSEEGCKGSQKKELGVELEATKVMRRSYPKSESQDTSQSNLQNPAKVNSAALSQASDKEFEFQMSEDELASAKSLTYRPNDQLAKDIVVAVSATAKFKYKDLSCATNGFADGNKIGEGGFGDVYLGVLKNSKCAVKKLRQMEMWEANPEQMEHHISEIKSLMLYRHENIVQLYGFAVDGDEICLVYQYMDNGSLEDRLQCKGDTQPLTWHQRINILCGGARGIQYLHTMDPKRPLIHADIKSANILLDKHFEAKISDFGLAEHANAGQTTGMFTHVSKKDMKHKMYKTRAYLPPEFFSNGPSIKSDTYGFGVIILETCTGEKAFDEKRESEMYLGPYVCALMEEQNDQTEKEWPNCLASLLDFRAGKPPADVHQLLKLAQRCISELKKKRPTMTVVLEELELLDRNWCADTVGVMTTAVFSPEAHVDGARPTPIHSPGHAAAALAYSPSLRSSLPRMASLPCTSTPSWHPEKCLTKSHSVDEVPESLRLQQMYDSYTYRERVRKVAREVFHDGSMEDVPGNIDGPVIEDPYRSNHLGMEPFDAPSSLDSNKSDKTLTENSSEPNLSGSEDSVSLSANEMNQGVGEDGSDLAKIQAMEEFDQAQTDITAEPIDSDVVNEKLKELKVNEDTKTPDASPEINTGNNMPLTSTSSEQTKKMASFFDKYAEEMASLNCDASGQGVASSGQTHTSNGNFVDSNQTAIGMPQEGMVFCGNSIVEGEEMAILLDTRSNQYFAVDPTTLDPGFYHHQQLSHYMQFQGDMSVNKDNATG
ncbi:uncharacterized protein LOC135469734 [Liolophura sinensis]|uniref:uncharacterized protein LOC135469734 n=1 Tax=Liolophura sinensis TaxID=3198878 RepID=UPI003158FAF5